MLTAVPSRASVPAAGLWVFTSPMYSQVMSTTWLTRPSDEARRLQGGGGLGLGVADHARDGGRVVLAEGQAALVAERDLAHVAQVDVLGRDGKLTLAPADA